jgi:hypothetical protein
MYDSIFTDFVDEVMEVFMDNFSIFGTLFNHFLQNISKVMERCKDNNIVLNWEKCHFMVKEGIVLGHKISGKGLEVDKANIEAIERLPPPRDIKRIRSFLGHAWF